KGVNHELFGYGLNELVSVSVDQELTQARGAGELLTVGQTSRCVDLNPAVLVAPLADAVEVFKSEANGVHAAVAGGADRVGAVQFQLLAHAQLAAIGADRLQLGNVRRGRRRRSAQKVF